MRAVLLECAYRPTPTIKSGRAYPEPPDWLVEAIITAVRQRQAGENVEVFKTLVASGKVPALRDFLAENPSALDATSRGLYDAQALSLLQLLIELPQGRASLAAYAQDFPRGDGGNPAGHLLAHFPTLAGSEQSLGKWWALSLARLASSDRFHGASPEETERQLAALLTIEVLQKDTARKFEIGQFAEYLKIPASRAALRNRILDLAALSTGAHALFRPVIAEYEQILAQIERGKIKDVPKQLASAATYRAMILSRLGDINDYLNWIEATQTPTESGAFKSTPSALPASPKRADAISKYLDAMEKAFND